MENLTDLLEQADRAERRMLLHAELIAEDVAGGRTVPVTRVRAYRAARDEYLDAIRARLAQAPA